MNALTPIQADAPIGTDNAVRLAGSVSEAEAELYFHALRGRLLNEFALAECAVDHAIARLIDNGQIEANYRLPQMTAMQRSGALTSLLEGPLANRRHSGLAAQRLEAWRVMLTTRQALVQGVMTLEQDEQAPGGWSVTIAWHGKDNGHLGGVAARWDMLAFGRVSSDIAAERRDLCAQLGQIGRRSHTPIEA